MQLDENTYEAYFLSYIDNELNAEEQKLVTQFIADYPNYAVQLEILKRTKLIPEEIIFEAKAQLYQLSEDDEQCIQYLDQEMSAEARGAFEAKCILEPRLANTLANWQKSYLDKKTILTENELLSTAFKNNLYHTEKETTLLIKSFQWTPKKSAMFSMAALCLLFIGYQFYYKRPLVNIDQSNTAKAVIPLPVKNWSTKNREKPLENTSKNLQLIAHQIKHPKKINSANSIQDLAKKDALVNDNSNLKELTGQEAAIDKIVALELNTMVLPTPSATTQLERTIAKGIVLEAPLLDEAQKIEYETITTSENEGTIYIGNFEIDESKLRGITRKINVLFKKNKNRDK